MNLFKKVEDLKNDYTTYPASFDGYKWFKPLLVGAVAFILFQILSTIPDVVINPATIDFANWGSLISNYYIIIYIPCIFFAALIVRDRPFSSYLSSHGGWKWGAFIKSFIVAFLVVLIFSALDVFINHQTVSFNNVKVFALVLGVIVIPFQCFSEELLFRGFVMQSLGSWIRIPIIPIVIQGAFFAYMHSYDISGLVGVLACGLIFGVVAWYFKGLEVSTAMHTSNNIIANLSSVFIVSSAADSMLWDSATMIAQMIIIFAVIYWLDKKFGWFE